MNKIQHFDFKEVFVNQQKCMCIDSLPLSQNVLLLCVVIFKFVWRSLQCLLANMKEPSFFISYNFILFIILNLHLHILKCFLEILMTLHIDIVSTKYTSSSLLQFFSFFFIGWWLSLFSWCTSPTEDGTV